jgi:hypothetical protein
MPGATLLALGAMAAAAAPDPWTKVREIRSGTEVRIVRDGVRQPIAAKFGEWRDQAIVVVINNGQVAIPRAEIERLDARPQAKRTKVESQSQATDVEAANRSAGQPGSGAHQGASTGGSVSFSKPPFETVYRRPPQKK